MSAAFPLLLTVVWLLLLSVPLQAAPDPALSVPSFENEVMAVLSRAGCNQGACHGNLNGKGGFRLSLRGEDPGFDYYALTHDERGRRINRQHAYESLIVAKPAATVPHEGGLRLAPGSREYEIITAWIRGGTPGPDATKHPHLVELRVSPQELTVRQLDEPVAIRADAKFSDGEWRDVTQLATFETTNFVASVDGSGIVQSQTVGEASIGVRYLDQQASVRVAFVEGGEAIPTSSSVTSRHWIDTAIETKLRQLNLSSAPLANDTTFMRRAFLDTLGRIPTGAEAQAFITDTSPDKRSQLIDRLVTDEGFAEFWALKWSDLLRNEEKLLDTTGVKKFHGWIKDAIQQDMPIDDFARQLISARGSTYEHPPANYYRALREPTLRAESTARLFLGVRLQCAKCHNHPFDRWKQDDYYAWARVFSGIEYEVLENKRKDGLDKSEFIGEQRIAVNLDAPLTNARTGKPAVAQFLGAAEAIDPEVDLLYAVAEWITKDNRQFALAQSNRIWYHLMGRGLVNPVDDFRVTNPASHPRLLERLADEFQQNDFRLRHLVKQIMMSNSYQAATILDDEQPLTADNYAGIVPRRLSAEQLLDAQTQVLDVSAKFNGFEPGIRAVQLPGIHQVRIRDKAPSEDERFLAMFGKPRRLMNCECERSDSTTLSQALYLISGPAVHKRLRAKDNRLARWLADELSNEQLVTNLVWEALSRPPTKPELRRLGGYLAESENRAEALRDVTWALLNAKEFLFRP